jgi:hypothetical protein
MKTARWLGDEAAEALAAGSTPGRREAGLLAWRVADAERSLAAAEAALAATRT